MAADRASRKQLWRWLGWFGLLNAAVLGVIGLRYLSGFSISGEPLAWLYLVSIYLSHYSWLALLPLLLLVGPLLLLQPARRVLFGWAAMVMALMIALLVLDSLLWAQSHFHINLLTAKILGWQSWLFAGVMFAIGLFFETLLAGMAWRWVEASGNRRGRWLAGGLVVCFVTAQGIYAWSDASYYTPVTSIAQQLPVQRGFTAKKLLTRHGLVDIRQARERQLAARMAQGVAQAATLDYPLAPLRCDNPQPLNLLVIMLDAWRSDMLSTRVTPAIAALAKNGAANFLNHYSGGNSSLMGVFSFFYGLPPGYFSSFEAEQRPAVLVDELQRQGYELGLFTSADMYRPVTLDRTAFARVPGLRLSPEDPAAPAWQRDADLNREWFAFLDQRETQRPFFGFLFYDATNARSVPPDQAVQFDVPAGHPMAQEFARYQASAHYVDGLVAQVLDDLGQRGLSERTVVMITADHGEEFMESGESFSIHGSGFSRYQLQVPMVIAWPGRAPQVYEHRTSHYDVAPTLLSRALGCSNPAADYTTGKDLFDGDGWDWLVAGSYYNYAMIEPQQVTVTFPNGLYEVRDRDYRLLDNPHFNAAVLQDVMRENRRFHR